MTKDSLTVSLEYLGFGKTSYGKTLLFTSYLYSQEEIWFSERLILEEAKKLKASAVYFRRLDSSHSSNPQLFIYDNTKGLLSTNELAEIHRKIWSSGIVPIYYVIEKSQIKIFDSRRPVNYIDQKISVSAFEVIDLVATANKEFKKYSAELFANGLFWEQDKLGAHFNNNKSAEKKLIEGLKQIRSKFLKNHTLKKELSHKLLVLSILVKYLEERKDEFGKHVFPKDFFHKYGGANSFCDVIRNGKLTDLFEDLSIHFNGEIFELKQEEKAEFINTDLQDLALYFDANVINGQLVIWPLYSFDYLPVELISRIYEEFINHRKDAVYTPTHLARFMVDECLPIDEPREVIKIADVSCGSGIFLVTVFKRLVQWWQKQQFDSTGVVKRPNPEILKKILKDSIFGIDIEPEAVRLTAFSLSIALCDMLSPTEIWTKLKFDDLSDENIICDNFFNILNNKREFKFDIIIGNPPFERFKKELFQRLLDRYEIDLGFNVPGNQIALLFLSQASTILSENGLLCLIMPSSSLLYSNSISFRRHFF
jgi:methylase of polypeptide subunit release factors